MKFKFVKLPDIPCLSWCAESGSKNDEIIIFHGSLVEIYDNWFFEGAWDGPFEEGGFVESTNCTGSGGKLQDEYAEFVSPTHPYRGLVMAKTPRVILVSNSLSFLLARLNDKPDMKNIHYYNELFNILKSGYMENVPSLKMLNGNNIKLQVCCNIKIKRDKLRKFPKLVPLPPEDFTDYKKRLVSMLTSTRENAEDANRKQKYEALTTLSRGYDSVGSSAISTLAGWNKAITMIPNDANDPRFNDDGSPIAEQLGIKINKYDIDAWRQRTDIPEAEFATTAWNGLLMSLSSIEKQVTNKLLILGGMGDIAWSPDSTGVDVNFNRRKRPYGVSMGHESHWEFQLRVGCITVFPPVFLAVHYDKLNQIMKSDEMKPWSIGGDYDRPIPRRLAEEMGVSRELFGQGKQASSHFYPTKTPSVNAFEDYLGFLSENFNVKLGKDFTAKMKQVVPYYFHWGISHTTRRYNLSS